MLRNTSFVLILAMLCVCCAYLGFDTTPHGDDYEVLRFHGGFLRVSGGECGDLTDETREIITEWADRAYEDWADHHEAVILTDHPKVYVRGMKISQQGLYDRNKHLVKYRCDKPQVIRHELFHAYCYIQNPGCDCFWIDHPEGTKVEDCHG